jgi:tripartite-type tricarboxylate transporter receptor subunit TctC
MNWNSSWLAGLAFVALAPVASAQEYPSKPITVVMPFVAGVARAGTPAPIVARWTTEINAALRSPKVIERLKGIGVVPTSMSVAAFDEMLKDEQARWARLFKERNIRPE